MNVLGRESGDASNDDLVALLVPLQYGTGTNA
jgi:hypothetical protein